MVPDGSSHRAAGPGPRVRSRGLAAVLAVVSAVVLLISVGVMIRRIRGFHEASGQATPFFDQVTQREFEFAGRSVSLTDEADEEGEAVVVRYGDEVLTLRPTLPPLSAQVPGLARHDAWLAVLRFVEKPRGTGLETDESLQRGELAERLVIVARDPHLELEGTAHGLGRPSDWTFDLHELRADGTIATERFGFPLSRRVARAGAEPAPGGLPPLREGTWQYYAALMTIPRGSRPTPAFTRDAVRSMGWTLPVAAFSGLVLTLSLPWVLAPRRSAPPA